MIILGNHKFDKTDHQGRPILQGVWEARCKFLANMLLKIPTSIIMPTYEEWVGLNFLERDGEL